MFEHILDCPRCGKRFHYEHEGMDFPEMIVCPECGESSESGDFEVLLLCHECHVKIKVPLSMLDDEDNRCPKCGAEIRNDRLTHLTQEGMTLTGITADGEKKRMLQDGDFFDKFQIIKLLGRGGMAEVYLAEHLLLKQKCALKLMQRTLDQDDNPVFIKRFVREAKLTHSFSHPNIVKVFDAGSDFKTGYLFLAMEYVEGETLHDIINARELSEKELLEILNVMANALKVLESAKVVHRDIKPSNIMYTKEGVYKLMDLGIAKMESNHQAGDMTLTMEQSTIGTPGYASPEQCSSAHLVDVRSDIFSLGASLYHAASGRLPFSGESPVVTILNTMQKDPEPLREFRPDLSDEFIGLIEKMMKKKPSERFQNMDELIEAIGKVEAQKTLPTPVRKFKTVVTAIGTTIFANKKNKEEKNSFKLTRHLGRLFIMLLVAAVAVPNIFYVINHMNDTQPVGGYVDFMKNFFVSFDVKKETPVTQTKTPVQPPKPGKKSEESIETLISNAKTMTPDPDPALQSVVDSGKKMYVKVALAAPLTQRLLYQHDFTKVSPMISGAAPAMIHDGLLDLSRNPNASVQCDDLIGFTNWSVFLHFELFEREKAPIFSASGLEFFVLNGTLRILYAGQYVDTRISPELGTWIDLTVSVNNSNGVLQLFSGDLLLRSYRFTPSKERTASVVKFYSPLLRKKMTGRIDYVALYKNALKIVPLQPSRRERFRTSEKRCPDGIALKDAAAQTTPEKEKKSSPAAAAQKSEVQKADTEKQAAAPKSDAYIKVTPWKMLESNSLYPTIEEELERSKENLKRYQNVVKQWEKEQNWRKGTPEEVKEARKLLLAKAHEIIKSWQERIQYLESRNRKIREVERRWENDPNAMTLYEMGMVNVDRSGLRMSKREDIRKIKTAISGQRLSPNYEFSYPFGSAFSSILVDAVGASFEDYSPSLCKILLKHFSNPEKLLSIHWSVFTRPGKTDIQWREVIKYGLPGHLLQHSMARLFAAFEKVAAGNQLHLMQILFMDGAILQPGYLAKAVQAGNYNTVLFLLACGVDPDIREIEGQSLYQHTFRDKGNGKRVRHLLLAAGADPGAAARQKTATDPSVISEFLKHWEMKDWNTVEKFLKTGKISPDFKLKDGKSLLFAACCSGNLKLVKMLLENGAACISPLQLNEPVYYKLASSSAAVSDDELAERAEIHKILALRSSYRSGAIIYAPLLLFQKAKDKNKLFTIVSQFLPVMSSSYEWPILLNACNDLNVENRRFLMSKVPKSVWARCFSNICHHTKLTPQMMQKALKAGVGYYSIYPYWDNRVVPAHRNISFSTKISQRADWISILIETKQPQSVIEMACKAEGKFLKLRQKQDDQRQNRR